MDNKYKFTMEARLTHIVDSMGKISDGVIGVAQKCDSKAIDIQTLSVRVLELEQLARVNDSRYALVFGAIEKLMSDVANLKEQITELRAAQDRLENDRVEDAQVLSIRNRFNDLIQRFDNSMINDSDTS